MTDTNWLKRLLCRHNTVHVERYHPETVTRHMRGKELYIDVYGVHNFVHCVHCHKVLDTKQRTTLYAERSPFYEDDDPMYVFKWMESNPTWGREWNIIKQLANDRLVLNAQRSKPATTTPRGLPKV